MVEVVGLRHSSCLETCRSVMTAHTWLTMTENWTSGNSGARRAPRRRIDPPELLELRQEARELRRGGLSDPYALRPEPRELRHDGPDELYELREEARELRRGAIPRDRRRPPQPAGRAAPRRATPRPGQLSRSRGRWRLLVAAALALLALVVAIHGTSSTTGSFAAPDHATLAHLNLGQRITAIANSQVGYGTDPANSYCNKFSAFWGVGSQTCPGTESSEEWCADFAAWAWQQAGVPFTYGFGPAEINAGAASFYSWGVAHGTWHSASSGYRAHAGDVAVYGLSLGASASAAHVAVVTGDPAGQHGPDVVNGDGDRTGFSMVERGTDQLRADTGHGQGAPLAGYVSPD
jgi:hypothetical protein